MTLRSERVLSNLTFWEDTVFNLKRNWPQAALILAGHGSTINLDSSAPTYQHAKELRQRNAFAEVQEAFWKERPHWHECLDLVQSHEVYIVPNFICEGYFTQEVLPGELKLTGRITVRDGKKIYYCDPIGTHGSMTQALLHRANTILKGETIDFFKTTLLLIGHGTTLHENSGGVIYDQVNRINQLQYYAEVKAAFMEQAPYVKDWQDLTSCPNVIAVPFFISNGLHSYEDIPVLMGLVKKVEANWKEGVVFEFNPYTIANRKIWYAPAIGTESFIADVILDLVSEFDKKFK